MAKIIKNNLGNLLVSLLIFSLVGAWFFTSLTKEVRADIETIRPTDAYVVEAWSNPSQGYDGNIGTYTSLVTVNKAPSISFGGSALSETTNAWQSKSQSWTAATLYLTFSKTAGSNDTVEVLITDQSGNLKHTIVVSTSNAVTKQEFTQALSSADWGGAGFPSIYNLRVRVSGLKVAGPDNASSYMYDVGIEGTYTPVGAITTLGDGTDPGNSIVAPGSPNNYLDQFTFTTSESIDEVTALTVTTANTIAIANMEIWNNSMTVQYFSTVSSPSGDNWNFSGGNPIPVTTAGPAYRVIFDAKTHATLAEGTYSVTGTVTSFTCTNSQAGSDAGSATITVDNDPPADATWGTITPGDQQVELNWTNPGDADFNKVLILRHIDSVVPDTPTEGTEYSVPGTLGASTIVYVGSDETFTDTGLINGTSYYYKIFAYDNFMNYAPGIDTDSHIPTAVAVPIFTQDDFRWYEDNDAIQPVTPKAAENTAITGVTNGEILRIRTNILVGTADLGAGIQAFKLQYGQGSDCTAIGSWTDVDVSFGSGIWRGHNGTPVDGTTLTATLLTASDVVESYEEGNPSVNNPNAITNGQQGEWDWVIENNGALDSTTYCFRTIKTTGQVLSGYNNYPKLTTVAGGVSPATPMADEDTLTSASTGSFVRLRIQVTATSSKAENYDYLLEYATKTGGVCGDDEVFNSIPFMTATEPFEITVSSYVSDGDPTSNGSQMSDPSDYTFTAGEIVAFPSNSSGSFTLLAGEYTEFEYVIQVKSTAVVGEFYCFRVTNAGSPLDDYAAYPELQIVSP